MAAIFSIRPGAIVAVDDPSIVGNIRTMKLEGITFGDSRLIITQIGLNEATEHQFTTSLADMIYLFSFGDEMGDLTIGGFASTDVCTGDNSSSGLKTFLDYYKNQRLSRRREPLSLTLLAGGEAETREVYLRGHRISGNADGATARVFQYSMVFSLVPEGLGKNAPAGQIG